MSQGRENFTIDLHSLKGFICILLISGYNALPRRAMYWQPTDDVYNAAVSSIMTRNRFDEIMQNLHLANNNDLDKNDKFAKVRPLINLLNKQFLEHFFPEQHIRVDEPMVPYYGKHGTKQYTHGKPIKFGYNTSFTGKFLHLVLRMSRFRPRSCFANCGFLALVFELLVCCIAMVTHNKIILLLKNTFCTKYKSI